MPRVISVSADQSQISTDVTTLAADGVAVCTVYVTAQQDRNDAGGQSLPVSQYAASNVTISVTPSTGVTITQPTGTADEDGTVTATFVSTNAATVSVGATAFGRTVADDAVVVVGGGAPPEPDPGDPFFFDDFAGGQKNSADGFTWSTTTDRVSVVTFDGLNCLRFRFGPDADGDDSSAQQNFSMGRNLSELWLQYSIWVPTNYAHRSQSGVTNNKFFRLWGDSYGSRNKVGLSSFRASPSDLRFEANRPEWGTSGVGVISGVATPAYGDVTGEWVQVRMHHKMVTAAENDGVIELWFDGVKVMDTTNLPISYVSGQAYWNTGYFFGWANSGFTEETDFHIKGGVDGPKFYDTDPGWT
jgi:hypothetical protein